MSMHSYGGIRGGAIAGRFGGQAGIVAQLAPAGGTSGGTTGQPGSPYTAAPPIRRTGPETHKMLLILVGLEALALVALRGGFRHYHGG